MDPDRYKIVLRASNECTATVAGATLSIMLLALGGHTYELLRIPNCHFDVVVCV